MTNYYVDEFDQLNFVSDEDIANSNGKFPLANWREASQEEINIVLNPPAPPVFIPQVVSMRQAQLALFKSGHYDAVSAAISSAGKEAMIWWATSTEVHRNNPLVEQITSGLGLSSSEVDNLFTLAASL